MRFSDTQRLIERRAAPLNNVGRAMRNTHIDGPLLGGLLLICGFGLVVLYSAVGENMDLWLSQCVRLGVGLVEELGRLRVGRRQDEGREGCEHGAEERMHVVPPVWVGCRVGSCGRATVVLVKPPSLVRRARRARRRSRRRR